MSWNDYLFWYAQDRGGTYFGRHSESYEGALLLEDSKGPILICTKVTYSGRYGTYRDVSAAARVELERPYTLHIKKQSAAGRREHSAERPGARCSGAGPQSGLDPRLGGAGDCRRPGQPHQ